MVEAAADGLAGVHRPAVIRGAVALDPDDAVVLSDLKPPLGVFAEVAILEAAAQEEETSVLQQMEGVGSIRGRENAESVWNVVIAWS